MKFPLSIAPTYCPEWGIWEIAREVISNALDAEAGGHPLTVEHDGDTLVVMNRGVKLDPSVWLLGTTDKKGKRGLRGQFGEGLKIAMLAAVRSGMDVSIVNDDEVWIPTLEESEAFPGIKVLTVSTRKTKATRAFTVAITGIGPLAWRDIAKRFTALTPAETVVETTHGSILSGPGHRGLLFVKGVFVQRDESLGFGYNFAEAKVDRDRKMVDSSDARISMAQCWIAAAIRHPSLVETVIVPLLEKGAKDVETMSLSVPDVLGRHLRDLFFSKYGAEAMPVRTPADQLQVGHYGKIGVVLPPAYVNILEKYMGSLTQHINAYKTAVDHVVGYEEMDGNEQLAFENAMELVEEAGVDLGMKPIANRTEVVVFKGENGPNGLHLADGKIQIARRLLRVPTELRRVLVHELAHDLGADGSKAHEVAEGRLHAQIQENLLERLTAAQLCPLEWSSAV